MIARILTTNTVVEVFPTMSPYSCDKFYTTQNGMVFSEKDLEILNGFELKRFNEQ